MHFPSIGRHLGSNIFEIVVRGQAHLSSVEFVWNEGKKHEILSQFQQQDMRFVNFEIIAKQKTLSMNKVVWKSTAVQTYYQHNKSVRDNMEQYQKHEYDLLLYWIWSRSHVFDPAF